MSNKNNYPGEYRAWKAMKARCYAPCLRYSGLYQSKNLQVCETWKNDFNKFLSDMGLKPSSSHSLDRIDNEKGYFPWNCRWATNDTQANNKSSNIVISHQGKSLTLKQWSRELDIKYSTLYLRIFRNGLTFDQAIKNDPYGRLYTINGESKIIKDWCAIYNINYELVIDRMHKGWSFEKALFTPKKLNHLKISQNDIPKIKQLLSKGFTNVEIGKIYNVHPSSISRIKHNHTYK